MQQVVNVLVLVPKGQEFLERKIMGRTVDEWVQLNLLELPSKRIQVGPGDDILTIVKRHGTNHLWTCVVYADMPLVMTECILNAVKFATSGEHKVVRLPRGWLFNTEHVKSGGEIAPVELVDPNPEHFMSVFNVEQLDHARKSLQRRININHMEAGVEIMDIDSTFIDDSVKIFAGVKILPFTIVTGDVRIESGATIGPFAHIRDDGKHIVQPEPVKEPEPIIEPEPEPVAEEPVQIQKPVDFTVDIPTSKPIKYTVEQEEEVTVEEPESEPVEIVPEELEAEEEIEEVEDIVEEVSEDEEDNDEPRPTSVKFDWDSMEPPPMYEGRD